MASPHWSLSEDRKMLRLDFPTNPPSRFELDATDTDELIANLADMREAMEPSIPVEDDPDPGSFIDAAVKGRWWVQRVPQHKGLAIALLHPGYRWVSIMLDYAQARRLSDTVRRLLPAGDSG